MKKSGRIVANALKADECNLSDIDERLTQRFLVIKKFVPGLKI